MTGNQWSIEPHVFLDTCNIWSKCLESMKVLTVGSDDGSPLGMLQHILTEHLLPSCIGGQLENSFDVHNMVICCDGVCDSLLSFLVLDINNQ